MGALNFSQLQKRLLSGFILGPLVVLAIFLKGWAFALMFSGFALTALYEWVRLSLRVEERGYLYLIFGGAYVLFCFSYLFAIGSQFPAPFTFLFIAMVWSSDIGGYFIGKKIGGSKMAPKISPNKTWAGLGGALLFPAVTADILFLFYAGYDFVFFNNWPPLFSFELLFLAALGAVLGTFGQAGDLIISFAKRKANLKDTGDIIPGHGGVLDRVDSMMLAAPVFYYAVMLYESVKSYTVLP